MAREIRKLGLVGALSLAMALSASAQRGGSAGRGFSAPARARGFSSSRSLVAPGRRIFGSAPGTLRPGLLVPPLVGTPLNPNFAPIRGVPGMGFDYQHLAAIEHPFLNRFGRGRTLFPYYPYFAPLFYDTLPLDDYDSYDGQYPYDSQTPGDYTQQPQFITQQPPPQASVPLESISQTPAPPPPELGELILVRRDGQILLAVAFTVRNGQLTYVTKEGARRSFPVSELDKDATREMNDANGTAVSLPE